VASRTEETNDVADGLPRWQAPLIGAATLSTLGVVEWAVARPVMPLEAASLSLLSVVAVHAGLGLVAGIGAQLLPSTRGSLSACVAAAVVSLLPAISFTSIGARAGVVGGLAAVALFPLVRRSVRALPLTASRLLFAHGFVLAAVVVLAASTGEEGLVAWPPIAAAALATAGLLHRPAFWPNAAGVLALVLLWAGGLPGPRFEAGAPEGGASVLLVTLDTLRADRLGFDGHEGAQTPNLDALAAEGRWFRNAQSLSSWTGPSHLSILTGRSPAGHGVHLNGRPLPHGVPTLGGLLSGAGWHTGAFVAGFPVRARTLGIRSTFHRYDDRFAPQGMEAFGSTLTQGLYKRRTADTEKRWRRNAADVNANALPWLEQERERPFLAWVHYYDPHLPYEQVSVEGPTDGSWYALSQAGKQELASSADAMAHMLALYDEQVSYTDRHLGELVAAARAASGGNLWIVITADHGESFGEHALYFARDAYEVTGRVPLIFVPPEGFALATGGDDQMVASFDVVPTLLTALGLEVPQGVEGIDVLSVGPLPDRALVKVHEPEDGGRYARSVSVRDRRFRLIQREQGWRGRELEAAETEFYDVAADPAEERDLAGSGHPVEARLRAVLPGGAQSAGGEETLDAETRDALKALGYLD
jgi:arylsulfatase A-like enzyme